MNEYLGILSAPPEKRYKNFISTVVDREAVWLLTSDDGYATYENKGIIYLLVWPRKEFAIQFQQAGDIPTAVDIHEFCDRCKELFDSTDVNFMVFPNKENSYVVDAKRIYLDILEELERVE